MSVYVKVVDVPSQVKPVVFDDELLSIVVCIAFDAFEVQERFIVCTSMPVAMRFVGAANGGPTQISTLLEGSESPFEL